MSPDHAAPEQPAPTLVSWLTPTRRGYLYRVAAALLAAGVAARVIGDGDVAVILTVLSAVLGVPMAALHTPTRT